jgi:hypothetical protein
VHDKGDVHDFNQLEYLLTMKDVVKKYDVAIAYRIYPKVAKPALGLPFSDDKYQLAEVCLESFRRSLGGLQVKIWVLLDGCPPNYADLFRKYFEPEDLTFIPLQGVGNYQTFNRQIEILLEQNDAELIYFAEDDYFYLPNQFHLMTDFLKAYPDADFVTPYDHLDCYTLELHKRREWLRVFSNHHWRTTASTCLTFLTTRRTLAQTARVFRTYSQRNYDSSLWLSLTKTSLMRPIDWWRWAARQRFLAKIVAKAWLFGFLQIVFGRRRKLWAPVPGIATHLDANALSPTIDWPVLMREQVLSTRKNDAAPM